MVVGESKEESAIRVADIGGYAGSVVGGAAAPGPEL